MCVTIQTYAFSYLQIVKNSERKIIDSTLGDMGALPHVSLGSDLCPNASGFVVPLVNVCMIYLQKESFVTPEFSFRIGTHTSAAGTLITFLLEFCACWGYLHHPHHICFPPGFKNLMVVFSLERLGPRARGLAITSWPGPSSL